ncbi:MAG: segregation/condensation protein A [Opitutales bacterium]|nr:segregation/condensation protein A [Opitutales bacterium]
MDSGSDMAVKLDVFEGPLDLLLFLIRKNEIDIYDIPIAEVTRQYMSVLRSMEKLSLEVAGEFFVMAATLMYIKSRMLLPSDERLHQENDDDLDADIDPRWQLVEQLLEYKKVKQAANALEDMIDNRQNYGERILTAKDETPAERPLQPSDRMEIWNTFNLILRRLAEKLIHGEIKGENVTVSDRMEFILSIKEKNFTFTSLFDSEKPTIVKIMATFLAMLELTRLKRLILRQDAEFGEIYCTKLEEPQRPETDPQSDEENPQQNLEQETQINSEFD